MIIKIITYQFAITRSMTDCFAQETLHIRILQMLLCKSPHGSHLNRRNNWHFKPDVHPPISYWPGKQIFLFPNHTTDRAKVGIFSWYFVKNYSFNFLKDLIWDFPFLWVVSITTRPTSNPKKWVKRTNIQIGCVSLSLLEVSHMAKAIFKYLHILQII